MKQAVKIFPVNVFKRGVCVFFGTREQFKKYLEKEDIIFDWDGENTDELLDKPAAITLRTKSDALIFAEQKIDEGVLIHEILHASKHILRICEIEDEESLAYLLEYLCGEILPWARTTEFLA